VCLWVRESSCNPQLVQVYCLAESSLSLLITQRHSSGLVYFGPDVLWGSWVFRSHQPLFVKRVSWPLVCWKEEPGRLQTGQTTTIFFPFTTMGASSRRAYNRDYLTLFLQRSLVSSCNWCTCLVRVTRHAFYSSHQPWLELSQVKWIIYSFLSLSTFFLSPFRISRHVWISGRIAFYPITRPRCLLL